MIVFWLLAGLLAAGVAFAIVFTASRARPEADSAPEVALYTRQLEEIDAQHAQGLLGDDERRAARAETGRRLLAAADAAAPESRPATRAGRLTLLAVAAAAPLVALAVYVAIGSPGAPDQPYAKRLADWRQSDLTALAPAQLAAVAEGETRSRPTDPDAWRMLGAARLLADDGFGAVQALERAARLRGTAADWAALGQALAVGGEAASARQAYGEALARDPASVEARFGLAQLRRQAGDEAGGRAAIAAIAQSLPADDPRRAALEAELAAALP